MKRSLLLFGVALFGVFGFTACEVDEVDNVKPEISLISPAEGEYVKPGNAIQLDMELSDEVALASYKVNIHGAFDGHSHTNAPAGSKTIFRSAEADSVEFIKTWLESDFIALGDEPIAGKRNATVHQHHILIPETVGRSVNGEAIEMPLKEGHYHFTVYCTDESGQESFVTREIVISYN